MTTEKTWQPYIYLNSSESAQAYLEKIYKRTAGLNSTELSYQNSCSFMYYLMHAESFYTQAGEAPPSIKPMLLFYGLTQLVKACLLTRDPGYPETTSVLAHGVTTRKKKKQDYLFLKDEIRIQKNGLLHHSAGTLFGIIELSKDRFSMEDLLRRIPEMERCFQLLGQKRKTFYLTDKNGLLCLPSEAAVAYHLSEQRLAEMIGHHTGLKPSETNGCWGFEKKDLSPFITSLFSYHHETGQYSLPADKEELLVLPELLTHYLLLYNLSMISRYETEWWYDLIQNRSSNDYIYIRRFMEITAWKIPVLVWEYLAEEGGLAR
ncbi:hypothetical protein GKZ89_20190 [Bacillus mangrovi]|uniref:YaaC-like Protein n=1 Tax=Metabacillus mangrovi TaxID=1491830 RepID=A0A7X2S9M7_9BACI|nr:YaaC family protein [Metabacillus mangrovi]MTH55718.1 hypothetical protein [Metabacillus mangrovi]